ncbi:MAG TPA: Ulp1 family isopeptidase, partial [Waddliaceae bacterium]
MEIKEICGSYFNCFSELKNYEKNDAQVTAFAVLKIFSFPTVFIPVGFGIAYGLALLVDHIKKIFDLSPQDQKISNIAKEQLGVQDMSQEQTTSQVNIDTSKASTPNCPKHLELFYQQTPKKFTEKIWNSSDYTSDEKMLLLEVAKPVYQDENGRPMTKTDWVFGMTTLDYFKWLATTNPTFSPIPYRNAQFEETTLEEEMDKILSVLPATIDQGPRIYGHPLRVNGNHRTAFIIDMDYQTVEYFNSFGEDNQAKKPLKALASALFKKYGVAFNYHHRTKNICLQSDTYQCGIWACKLIEERRKQGISFNPADCKNFDISQFRIEVFAKVYEV